MGMIPGELDLTCVAAWTAPGQVRTLVEFRLTEWGLLDIAPDVYLVAGELIANAVEATPDLKIRIRVTREPGHVLLGVWDSSDELPRAKPITQLTLEALDLSPENFDRNGGWGLPLVKALSHESGVQRTAPHGKWIWSRLTTTCPPGRRAP